MPLKMAIVGAGHMGRIHLEKLKTIKNVQITGIVDIKKQLAEGVSEKNHIPFFTDYRKILPLLNGVIITTPTETHYKIAKIFLENGTHVFIEKPITSKPAEANKLIEIANKKGLILQVGHLERFNPAYTRAIPFIKKPLFIEARRISMFTGRSTDIDVVLDLMIHDIDLILSLVKENIREVRAQGIPLVTDKLDVVNARIEFTGGCVAHLTASRISTTKERTLTVFEKDRYLIIDLLNGKLTMTKKNKKGKIETTEYAAEKIDSVKLELMEFVDSIRGAKNPSIIGEDGLNALVLANQIKQYIAESKSL
jgi:predicted dehydrogenase